MNRRDTDRTQPIVARYPLATLLVLTATLIAPISPCNAATLVPPAGSPVEGETFSLVFETDGAPAAGLAVTASYRSNAHEALQSQQAIGSTDASGQVRWTPERAGVVVLSWEGGSENISVLHAGLQPAAIAIGALAGILLLGGSALFFAQMLREGKSDFVHEIEEFGEPPSS